MAANEPVVTASPRIVVEKLSNLMQAHAGRGEWSEVEDLAIRLRNAVMNVPAEERRDVLVLVQRATDEVAAKARDAHGDVSAKLAKLRRGQVATEAYKLR